jgi:hypothetical protein
MSTEQSTRQHYTPPPPHPLPPDAAKFLASLDPVNRRLHEIAAKSLGSSYFMDRCHGYKNWKKAQAAAGAK